MAAFLLDENVSIRIANHLTALGHHATPIVRAGYGGLPDPDVLLLAQRWQHVLITHNRGDFQLLHRGWRLWGAAWGIRHRHAGILILDQLKGMHAEAFAQVIVELVERQPDIAGTLSDWRRDKGWTQSP